MASELTAGLRLRRAASPKDRLRGLLGRVALAPDEGLVLEPCDAIHTFAMRYAVDAVFVDRAGRVLRVVACLAPWRIAWTPGARAVIETTAGTAARLGIVPGRILTLP